jgi:hypothetical protein
MNANPHTPSVEFDATSFSAFARDRLFPEKQTLDEGEVACSYLLHDRAGVWLNLGPNAAIFEAGTFARRSASITTIQNQSPHDVPLRTFRQTAAEVLLTALYGGGDVYMNKQVASSSEGGRILISAGTNRVANIFDIGEVLDLTGAAVYFLPRAFLASANLHFRSVTCSREQMLWAGSINLYRTEKVDQSRHQSFLCVAGGTTVWNEVIDPGTSQTFAPGRIIGISGNVDVSPQFNTMPAPPASVPSQKNKRFSRFTSVANNLLSSALAVQTPVVFKASNPTDKPGVVLVQLNPCGGFYTGYGLAGVAFNYGARLLQLMRR